MRSHQGMFWDAGEECYLPIEAAAPSAEDEYFASLEPEEEGYEFDIILAQSKLTKKQLFVIECRYGFRGPEMSLEQIAALMGVSRQAVHRLIERALVNLRKGLTKTPIYRGHNDLKGPHGEPVELQLDSVDHPPSQAA